MAKDKKIAGKNQRKYVGPFVIKGHVLNGKTYNPETMTDEEIEYFQALVPEAKGWWKNIEVANIDDTSDNEPQNDGSEN